MADPVFSLREYNPTGGIDEQGYRTYRRTWHVTCSDATMGPRGVAEYVGLNAQGIKPGLWAQYKVNDWEIDLYARCKKQDASLISANDPHNWVFTADYDSKPFDFGAGGVNSLTPGTSPTDRTSVEPILLPWMFKSVTVEQDIAITTSYDIPSRKIRASNGQSYSPSPTVKRYIPGVQITTYAASPPWAKKVRYTGAINDATWQGFGPETVLCSNYEITSVFNQNLYYWQVDITLLLADPEAGDPDWSLRILDAGSFEYISTVKPNEKIKDSQGNFVSDPVPLDGNGRKLAPGLPLIYNVYRQYKMRDFDAII